MQGAKWQIKIAKDFEQGKIPILTLEDEFSFDNSKCITECGGKCCFNTDVLINPYDVYRIVTSETGRKLGLDNTTKLFCYNPNFNNILMSHYIGENSKAPVATINFEVIKERKNGTRPITKCPFLQAIYKVNNEKDMEYLYKKQIEKLEFLKTPSGNLALFCIIEDVKPTICRAMPVGRYTKWSKDEESFISKNTEFIYIPPTQDCSACNTDKKIKLKDYIQKWNLEEQYRMSDKYFGLVSEFTKNEVCQDKIRELLGIMLYNFDFPFIKKGLNPVSYRPNYEELINTVSQILIQGGDKYGRCIN